jgi:hypothetical protein
VYEDGTIVYLSQEDSSEFELSLGDIIDEVMNAHHEPGDTLGYWKGELKRIPNNRFVNAQAVLSQIESAACDKIAEEYVYDFLSCVERQEAVEELSSLLSRWADKWMSMPVYEVKNVTWVDYDTESDE